MKLSSIILLAFSAYTSVYSQDSLIAVKYTDTLFFEGRYTWTYESFINSSDSTKFQKTKNSDKQCLFQGLTTLLYFNYADSTSAIFKGTMVNGQKVGEWREYNKVSHVIKIETYNDKSECVPTSILREGHLWAEGTYCNGKRVDKWKFYSVNPPFKLYSIDTYNEHSVCIKTEYYENGVLAKTETYQNSECVKTEFYKNGVLAKTENTKAIDRHNAYFENYHVGIQPPLMIDWAYPTGVTVSSFNFHADIPGRKNRNDTRAQIVAAAEAGLNGFAFRGGVSPFLDDEFFDAKGRVNLTPFTTNVSISYLYRDQKYKKLDNLEKFRWYVGGDIDFAYMYGHIRAGLFRMIGPEPGRPVQFMFSIGISPNFIKLVGDGFMF